MSSNIPTDVWYCWRVFWRDSPGERGRLIYPRVDPSEYESAFNYIFATEAEARQALIDYDCEREAKEQGWILCRETTEPVGLA